MTKTEIERHHIDQFLRLLTPDYSSASHQLPPEPDFVADIFGKQIGIEHTRLVRKPDQSGVDIMAHTVNANRIMDLALSSYSRVSNLCLMVHADFRCSYGLKSLIPIQLHNADLKPISEFISEFVIARLSYIGKSSMGSTFEFESFDWRSGTNTMPEKIDGITITNTSRHQTHCWTANQAGMVPGVFQSSEFAEIITKKNKKPSNYSKGYDEIWLLIVEDSMDLTSYFHFEDQANIEVSTEFDKIYILRRADNLIIKVPVKEK